ncbi:MAG: hypothetical protein N4A41_08190 [Crocinitomicaceae bacterium]|jgi:hypothetical protein|nr:hypothetical protein [Crocinitomicaceae bacterium]
MLKFLLFILTIIPSIAWSQFVNGSQMTFGKSRVQYYEFDWREQKYERFSIHSYRGEEDLSDRAAQIIQKEIEELEQVFQYKMKDRLEILLFKSLHEFRQTNLGLKLGEEEAQGGQSQLVNNQLLLYFDEGQLQFQQQIRYVLAQRFLYQILLDDDWSSILITEKASVHPTWFIKGLASFYSQPWDAQLENEIKEGVLTGKYLNIAKIKGEEERVFGHAFWYFIEQNYGASQLTNLVFLTKVTGHIDRSLKYILGRYQIELMPEFMEYYGKRFSSDLKFQKDPPKSDFVKHKGRVSSLVKSPDGRDAYWIEEVEGKIFVVEQMLGKKPKVLKAFEAKMDRIKEAQPAHLVMHPKGNFLACFYVIEGYLHFSLFDLATKEITQKKIENLDQVLGANYHPNGLQIGLSAVKNGQTDIFLYRVGGNSLDQITNDLFDDFSPCFDKSGELIYFQSNRISDSLKSQLFPQAGNKATGIYGLKIKEKDRSKPLLVSFLNHDKNRESNLFTVQNELYFVSDLSGSPQLFQLKIDSAVAYIDTAIHYRYIHTPMALTNWNTGVLEAHYSTGSKDFNLLFHQNGQDHFVAIKGKGTYQLKETYFKQKSETAESQKADDVKKELPKEEVVVETELSSKLGYEKDRITIYGDEVATVDSINQEGESTVTIEQGFQPAKREKYKLNFAHNKVSFQVQNSFLNQNYQKYEGPSTSFRNPSLSGLFSLRVADYYENYVLTGYVRIPTSRGSGEFLFELDFLKKRWDKRISYYRRGYETATSVGLSKSVSHQLGSAWIYPFTEVLSFRTSLYARMDIQTPVGTDPVALERELGYEYAGGTVTSLVFDNARWIHGNAWKGIRAKLFFDLLQNTQLNGLGMFNIGADLRASKELYKEMVWVNRLAGGASYGGEKLLYTMGGVDNWMLRGKNGFNASIGVDPKENFAYQTLATPMRGFAQNQRNGSRFFVYNMELRIPVAVLIAKYKMRSEALRTFQVVNFFDLGTAWTGPSPLSDENFFNQQVIQNKPAVIELYKTREPVIAAAGVGLRSKIFGYFVRLDLGWGIENFQFTKRPRLFFTLTNDI